MLRGRLKSYLNTSEIAKLLEATVKDLELRSERIEPANLLMEFYTLVNKRISVPLSTLEVILYSSMAVSPSNGDYSLPKTFTQSGVGVMKMLLGMRSASATFAFEGHRQIITSPSSYLNQARMDHVCDALIAPVEVMANKRLQQRTMQR